MRRWTSLLRGLTNQGMSRPTDSAVEVYDATAVATDIDLSVMEVIHWAPVWMTRAERLLLYTLTFTLRPTRYLEIGTLEGGSALLVATAMDSLNLPGRLVCVDPEPKIDPKNWQRLEHRTTLLKGYSPDILPQACKVAGGLFDLVLIDGDHTYDGVVRDANGVLPYVANNAYILFHDSFFSDVARGIDDFVGQHRQEVVDFGTLTREITTPPQSKSLSTRWGGLRMMQVRRGRTAR